MSNRKDRIETDKDGREWNVITVTMKFSDLEKAANENKKLVVPLEKGKPARFERNLP